MSKKITKDTTPIELTAIVSEHLAAHGIVATLTGGTVVSIYTDNKYESGDLDFISPADHKEILKVMEKLDFKPVPATSKNLHHGECPITVEFPARTLIPAELGSSRMDLREAAGGSRESKEVGEERGRFRRANEEDCRALRAGDSEVESGRVDLTRSTLDHQKGN